MKPVELCKKAILNSSKTDDIILDPFGGSGSTLIATRTNKKKMQNDRIRSEICGCYH